jgi:hypothetical protein
MNFSSPIRDQILFNLTADFVRDAITVIDDYLIPTKRYIASVREWPETLFNDHGMVRYWMNPYSNLPDYRRVFGSLESGKVELASIESYKNLLKYVEVHPVIRAFYSMDTLAYMNDLSDVIYPRMGLDIIGKYKALYPNSPFEIEKFMPLYSLIETAIFDDDLKISIAIPIVFLKFPFSEFQVSENIKIVEMDSDLQRACALLAKDATSISDYVLNGATHMLHLSNYNLKNRGYVQNWKTFTDLDFYPLDLINDFFTALRLVSGPTNGFALLLILPNGWADALEPYLPRIYGTTTKAFPSTLERRYWHSSPISMVGMSTTEKIRDTFLKIQRIQNNRFTVAKRRFDLGMMRENEQDAIIDVTIAMEALLGTDSQEMTHKLSLRMGALAALVEGKPYGAKEVFRKMKKIYAYRSAIVHGENFSKLQEKREVRLDNGPKELAIDLALEYLEMAMMVLLDHSTYLDHPEAIDWDLLLKIEPPDGK